MCGSEVIPGTEINSKGQEMILYFKGEQGGFRGFKAVIKFKSIPNCCRQIVNGSREVHVLSPQAPYHEKYDCSLQFQPVMGNICSYVIHYKINFAEKAKFVENL